MAFLTMLQIVGKVANDATGAPSSTASLSPEKLFLSAFVDYILDEEMPLELDDQVMILHARFFLFLFLPLCVCVYRRSCFIHVISISCQPNFMN